MTRRSHRHRFALAVLAIVAALGLTQHDTFPDDDGSTRRVGAVRRSRAKSQDRAPAGAAGSSVAGNSTLPPAPPVDRGADPPEEALGAHVYGPAVREVLHGRFRAISCHELLEPRRHDFQRVEPRLHGLGHVLVAYGG